MIPEDDLSERLETARRAFRHGQFDDARRRVLSARLRGAELAGDDLALLGEADRRLGRTDEAVTTLEAAYHAYLGAGRAPRAAAVASDIATCLLLRGDRAGVCGWMNRARRLLADEPESATHGYALYLLELDGPLEVVAADDAAAIDALLTTAERLRAIGHRRQDADLTALATMAEGRLLVKQGRTAPGLALLDESMLAVRSGDLTPEWAGHLTCHLTAAAVELVDLRRATEWTSTITTRCDRLPDAVLLTGICRVRRAQVHRWRGAWDRAGREASRVHDDLVDVHPATAAEGAYELGELHRLRGELDAAAEAYGRAHALGRDPQPGRALLLLAQGRIRLAEASIRTALLAQSGDRLARASLCAAEVEIALADEAPAVAARGCEELSGLAATYGSCGLEAMARHAQGARLLADGQFEHALPVLRDACRRWHDVHAPYHRARARALLARAHAALGDADGADRERTSATATFRRLGTSPELWQFAGDAPTRRPDGLTSRETEVLACVAAGRTNRQVAADLVISEKTVARHLSNIFAKLDVPSRTAATLYAVDHGLAPIGNGGARGGADVRG